MNRAIKIVLGTAGFLVGMVMMYVGDLQPLLSDIRALYIFPGVAIAVVGGIVGLKAILGR